MASDGLAHTARPLATFAEQCRAIVGAPHVRAADPDDHLHSVPARLVVEPGTEQEVAAILRLANDAGLAVAPRGGGTKLDWGNPLGRADVILSLARLDRVIDHAWADLTVTVEAGCTVARLQETLAQNGQRLAVDVLWPEQATVGGILSTNDSGALRLRYGGLRDLVIGVTLALADGTLAASGGRVVKNVAGYDLQKLATGALGTLGVITRATFRVHPLPKNTQTFLVFYRTASEAQELMLAIQDSQLAISALQLHGDAHSYDVAVLLEGTEAGIEAQLAELSQLAEDGTAIEGNGVWGWRQDLWDENHHLAILELAYPDDLFWTTIAKFMVLPSNVAHTLEAIALLADASRAQWEAVVQATGIGYLRLDSRVRDLTSLLGELRRQIERQTGSLVLLEHPSTPTLDTWGDPGDALPVMRALKEQLDPRGTLNPGRFLGGI